MDGVLNNETVTAIRILAISCISFFFAALNASCTRNTGTSGPFKAYINCNHACLLSSNLSLLNDFLGHAIVYHNLSSIRQYLQLMSTFSHCADPSRRLYRMLPSILLNFSSIALLG